VVAQIAAALSLRESGGRGLEETLHDYLASKEMLLVIDNFEQVMDAASEVASLLSGARVLVTSREPGKGVENGFSLKATCGEPLNLARFLDSFLTLLDSRDFLAIQAHPRADGGGGQSSVLQLESLRSPR